MAKKQKAKRPPADDKRELEEFVRLTEQAHGISTDTKTRMTMRLAAILTSVRKKGHNDGYQQRKIVDFLVAGKSPPYSPRENYTALVQQLRESATFLHGLNTKEATSRADMLTEVANVYDMDDALVEAYANRTIWQAGTLTGRFSCKEPNKSNAARYGKPASEIPDEPVACDNCEWTGGANETNPIKDLEQRIDPGGVVPSGECPKCGALCYPTAAIVSDATRYVVAAHWEHLDNRSQPWQLRWVYDRAKRKLVAAETLMPNGVFLPFHDSAQTRDLLDHIEDANADLLLDPDTYGVVYAKELPEWAKSSQAAPPQPKETKNDATSA